MIIARILQRVVVNHFYTVNGGFFLFGFFVLFGLPYQPLHFHRSLINGIIESQHFLGVVMIVWVLYCLKCIDYTSRHLAAPRQNFLFCLNNVGAKRIYGYLVYVQFCMYLPVLVYATCMVGAALQKKFWWVAAEVVLFTLAALLLPAWFYLLVIQKRWASTRVALPQLFSFSLPSWNIQ